MDYISDIELPCQVEHFKYVVASGAANFNEANRISFPNFIYKLDVMPVRKSR